MSRFVLLPLTLTLLAACSDVVTTTYASKAAATEEGLVARGWLPSVIPDSSTKIRTSNDLDLNISEGSFEFRAEDWSHFSAQLQVELPAKTPFADWQSIVRGYRSRGYSSGVYKQDHTIWVFFCKPQAGSCKYTMWLVREARSASAANRNDA